MAICECACVERKKGLINIIGDAIKIYEYEYDIKINKH